MNSLVFRFEEILLKAIDRVHAVKEEEKDDCLWQTLTHQCSV